MFAGIRRWDLVLMFVLLGAVFVFEMVGASSSKMVTITQIVKAFMPMPLRFMVYAWLGWHMIISDLVKQASGK